MGVDIPAPRSASRVLAVSPQVTIGRRVWHIYEAERVRWQLPSLVFLRFIMAEWYTRRK